MAKPVKPGFPFNSEKAIAVGAWKWYTRCRGEQCRKSEAPPVAGRSALFMEFPDLAWNHELYLNVYSRTGGELLFSSSIKLHVGDVDELHRPSEGDALVRAIPRRRPGM